jgi:hypothetical protein
MGLIEGVSLFDVANVEAFIQRALARSKIRYEPEEHEELLAMGWTVFYELACKYKPLPEPPCGYEAWFAMTLDDRQVYEARAHLDTVKRGRFSGHMAMFFPRRFGDEWHKANPHHRYVTDRASGKRGWIYGTPMVSLDALAQGHEGREGLGLDNVILNARTINGFCHATATKLGLSRVGTSIAAR